MGFKDLLRWDVAGFLKTGWLWPSEVLQPMGSVVRRVVSEVDGKTPKNELPIIGKITFGGELSLSDEDERLNYKGRLFWAAAGQLVFSKIRLKQGSFCFVPESLPSVAVSAEYPVFDIAEEKAVPAFLDLLLRSEYMKAVLDGLAHGGGTKTRIHPAQFEALEIPIPPLVQQQAIVSQWQALQDAAQQAAARADACEAAGREAFLRSLGLEAPVIKDKVRAFAVRWSELERWGGEANRLGQRGGSVAAVAYPLVQGKDFIREVSHGCSASPSTQPTALEVLKISAVTKGWLDISEKKFAPDEPRLRMQFALKQGDVLLCRTNGTLAYVGAAALVEEDQSDLIYPDKVIRVRLQDNVVPAFFWQVLRTPYLRAQIESFARTAVGNYAIGGKDIWQFRIPLPPLNVQKNLVTAINDARAEAARLRSEAAQLRQQAQREIEAALLGHPLAERVDG